MHPVSPLRDGMHDETNGVICGVPGETIALSVITKISQGYAGQEQESVRLG